MNFVFEDGIPDDYDDDDDDDDELCGCEGILVSGNGERTIRLRPSLIFQQHHADILLSILDQVLRDNQ